MHNNTLRSHIGKCQHIQRGLRVEDRTRKQTCLKSFSPRPTGSELNLLGAFLVSLWTAQEYRTTLGEMNHLNRKSIEVFLIRDLCIARPISNNDRHPFLRNKMSVIIGSYINLIKFAAYTAVSSIPFFLILLVPSFYHCLYGCMFCMLLFNFSIVYSYCYAYVSLLLLCTFRVGCSVSLCCSVYCLFM